MQESAFVFKMSQMEVLQNCFRQHNNHICVQAVEGREAALQQVEEARLALRAADRDNAELQARLQQASMSISSRHRQHAEPTARQLWAVPRERTGAFGSTAVSPVSRYNVLCRSVLCLAVLCCMKSQLPVAVPASLKCTLHERTTRLATLRAAASNFRRPFEPFLSPHLRLLSGQCATCCYEQGVRNFQFEPRCFCTFGCVQSASASAIHCFI